MGLAGVGGSEDGNDIAAACRGGACGGRDAHAL
jgi:hypothetical protein